MAPSSSRLSSSSSSRRSSAFETSRRRQTQRSGGVPTTPSIRSAAYSRAAYSRAASSRPVSNMRSHTNERPPEPTRYRSVDIDATTSGIGNGAEEDLFDDDSMNETVMAIDVRSRGTIGCAYYVAREEKLYFMEDVKLGGPDTVEACRIVVRNATITPANIVKLFISPTTILAPYRLDETVLDRLDPDHRSRETSTDDRSDVFNLPYQLDLRPSGEFNHETAKYKLVSLKIGQEGGPKVSYVVPGDMLPVDEAQVAEDSSMTYQGQLLKLSGRVDMESQITVGCAGAVLGFVHRRRTAAFLPGDENAHSMFRISTVEMFSLRGTMFINTDSLLSLQIVQAEAHPNAHNQGPKSSGSKEGLSVYGLFHHLARTPQGKFLLRQYFLRPSLNIEVLNQRLDTISHLIRPDNQPTMEAIIKHIKPVKNMRTVMVSLRKGISGGIPGRGNSRGVTRTVWSSIREFVFRALSIKDSVAELTGSNDLPVVQKIMNTFDGQPLAMVGRAITDIVDFEASAEHRRTVVKTGIDEELDNMKRTYDGLESLLSRVASHIAQSVPAKLDAQVNVIFFPQIGFLIAVRSDPDTGNGIFEGTEDDPWEKMFTTQEFAYYKNSNVTEMDSYLGDIYGQICDKEIEITQNLAERVLQFGDMLTSVSDICGELDSLLALAQGALQYNLIRPRVVDENVIDIKGGRHPLQELAVPSYVANDTLLRGGTGRAANDAHESQDWDHDSNQEAEHDPGMVVLTGPNYSGKSVYLKQVAIITLMAHVGSYVPAESARIGITDKILTRISTRESVSRNQSAFMIDVQQVSIALSLATNRSLLVFDEFGKGTESYDGAGLAAGVFQHLLRKRRDCPKVLAATHFHEIFECGFFMDHPSMSFGHMEVRVDEETSHMEQQLTYLYNYRNGRSISSYGTCCAALNGIDPGIIQRAENLIRLSMSGEDLVAACASMPSDEIAEARQAETIARNFLRMTLEQQDIRVQLGHILGDSRQDASTH